MLSLVVLITTIKKLKEDLNQIKYALIPLTIYCIFMQVFFKTICPIKAFFKVDCPGCGLTRASLYLLKGDIQKSLSLNPTAIFWILCIILFIIDRYFHKLKINIFPTCFIITSVITLTWFVTKTLNII